MKKILAVLLAVALVATLSLSAVMTASAISGMDIVTATANATKGETKEITISLANNPGIASIKLSVAYDSDLSIKSVKFADKFTEQYTYMDDGEEEKAPAPEYTADKNNPATINWISKTHNVTGDGTFVTIKFTVSESATLGDKDITVTVDNPNNVFYYASGTYEEQTLKGTETNVPHTITNGKITVVDCLHDGGKTAHPAVASTCKTAGHAAYTTCDKCNAVIEGSDAALDLDPNNHEGDTEVRGKKDASCSEAGYTGDTYCLGCGAKIAEGKEIEKTAHKVSEWLYDAQSHWKECTVCKEVIEVSAPHTFEEKVTKEPTTEAEGQKAKVCSVCGYTDESTIETIPKLIAYDSEQTEGKTEDKTAVYDGEDAKAIAFTAKFAKNKLTAVKVNGEEVSSDNYTVSEDEQGNAVVKFTDAYLAKLGNGNYTVDIYADDGVATQAFTVKNNAAAAPAADTDKKSSKTGDMNIALLVFALIALMGASVSAGVIYRRKNESK